MPVKIDDEKDRRLETPCRRTSSAVKPGAHCSCYWGHRNSGGVLWKCCNCGERQDESPVGFQPA